MIGLYEDHTGSSQPGLSSVLSDFSDDEHEAEAEAEASSTSSCSTVKET